MSKALKKLKKGVKKIGKKIKKGVKSGLKSVKRFGKKYGKTILGVGALALGGAGLMGMGPLGGALGGVGSSISSGLGGMFKGGMGKMFGGGSSAPMGGMAGAMGGGGGFDWGNLAMAGIDAYGSYQTGKGQQEGAQQAMGMMNPFAPHRAGYAKRLSELYADPSSIAETPGYKFQMEQGMQAMGRTSAARGSRLSGGALVEAQKFGQGLASQMRQQEIQNLSMLSGAGFGPAGGQYAMQASTAMPNAYQEGAGTIGHALGYGR
jgi:hypothetical protein